MFKALSVIDSYIRTLTRERDTNEFSTIDDLPLSTLQKQCVLEWFARKLDNLRPFGPDSSKHYDPLMIEGNVAYSYAFDMEDGGRTHSFRDLTHLEEMLVKEIEVEIKDLEKALKIRTSPRPE